MTNKITARQGALFASIIIFASKLLILPSQLYSVNGTGGLFCLIAIFAIELGFLFLLIDLKIKNKTKTFEEIFEQKLGKILTKAIIFILFLFFLLKSVYILEEGFVFLKHTLYTESSIFVYLICVLPIVTALAYKGLKAFGRTLELFYPIIVVLITLCTFIWGLNIENFTFAILDDKGIGGFFSGIFTYTFWFGDFVFLMYILDKVNFDRNSKPTFYGHTIFSMVLLIIFSISYFVTFQTTSFVHTYAIFDIVQFVSEFGTIGKFDLIAVSAIMFIIYFQIGMFMFCASDCLAKVIPFGHKAQPLIIINLLMIAASYAIFNNANSLVIYFGEYLKYFSIICTYFIPVLFVVFSYTYKKPKRRTLK